MKDAEQLARLNGLTLEQYQQQVLGNAIAVAQQWMEDNDTDTMIVKRNGESFLIARASTDAS